MAVTIYYEEDVDPKVIQGMKVAIRLSGPCTRTEPEGFRR